MEALGVAVTHLLRQTGPPAADHRSGRLVGHAELTEPHREEQTVRKLVRPVTAVTLAAVLILAMSGIAGATTISNEKYTEEPLQHDQSDSQDS